MTTAAGYERRIARYNVAMLIRLWDRISRGRTPHWDPGKALEYLVIRAFQLEGAEVRWPYSVRIEKDELEQIDGVVYTDGLSCLVECKDKSENLNIEPIAKLRNQVLRRPSTVIGIVFSRQGFTDAALTLAQFTAPQVILLWSGEEVKLALENSYMRRGLLAKYRHCIEYGLPDYNLKAEFL